MSPPAFLVGIGSPLHIVADRATVSGVHGFGPRSENLFIMLLWSWRIKSSLLHDIVVMLSFGVIT